LLPVPPENEALSFGKHRLGNIDGKHLAGGTDEFCYDYRSGSAAASDIDHLVARLNIATGDRRLACRRENPIKQTLERDVQ
jgi:hypothetical protein